MRSDPISGRQVLIAEDRSGRPNDFSRAKPAAPSGSEGCPFCAGHEDETPEPTLEVALSDEPWQVRVVPNKYPAVSFSGKAIVPTGNQSLTSVATQPFGAHEVIIESPRHVQDIVDLTPDEFALVLRVYRDRLRHWSTDDRVQHVTLFKNQGPYAGASLEHIHSQLIALPTIPPVMATELEALRQYHAEHQACLLCDLMQVERSHSQRLVAEAGQFVSFCAYAGRQPYETWIVPQQHSANFEQLEDADLQPLASLLQNMIRRLQTQLQPLSYNLILHTAPFQDPASNHYHWHFELVPRTTQLAGFEWGAGMYINPLSPERAAARLRDAQT